MAATAAQFGVSRPPRGVARNCLWILAAVIAAHSPLLTVHLSHVWNRPHYCFALFLLPIVGWLMRRRWPHEQPYVTARWLQRLLLGGSVGCLGLAIGIHSPYLAAVSGILATGFAILHVAGLRAIPALFGTWMLLWLVVPPPLGIDLLLISRMQTLTSQLASRLLDLLGINHLMAGNILHLQGTTLFVDEACSGVHSLFALIGCTAVFAVMTRRTCRRGGLLLVSSLGWAILLNLLRVMTIALTSVWWGIDLATGWAHETLGLATFLLALALMLSTDQWLHFTGYLISRLSSHRWREKADTGRLRSRPSSTRARAHLGAMKRIEHSLWTRMTPSMSLSRTAIAAYGLLFAASVAGWSQAGSTAWTELSLSGISPDVLPQSLGTWSRQDFQRSERSAVSPLGWESMVWTFLPTDRTSLGASCKISLDAPFSGWHELTRCYEGIGWQLKERSVTVDTVGAGRQWVESRFSNAAGQHALLIFSMITADGRPLTPTTNIGTSHLVDRLCDRPGVQLQGFIERDSPIDEALRNELRTIVRIAADRAAAVLHAQNGESSSG